MTYSDDLKKRVREMRESGLSIGVIARQVNLSKSTISVWVRDVKLSVAVQEKLHQRSKNGLSKAMGVIKKKVVANQRKIDEKSKDVVIDFDYMDKNNCRIIAAMLFWCEGGKTELGSVKFANSDPGLIRAFLFCLRRGFNIDESRFHALIHLHEYHNDREQKRFWSLVTGIPVSRFHKSYKKLHTGKRKRQNYQGCLSIRYGDANVAKMLSSIYHAFADRVGP